MALRPGRRRYSPVGGGHRSAALAVAEAARARGLSVEVLDTFEHAPRVLGPGVPGAHLAWTGRPRTSTAARTTARTAATARSSPCDARSITSRGRGSCSAWCELAPRAVIATHHLPLVVLGRARRKGRLASPAGGRRDRLRGARRVGREGRSTRSASRARPPAGDAMEHGFPAERLLRHGHPRPPRVRTHRARGAIRPPARRCACWSRAAASASGRSARSCGRSQGVARRRADRRLRQGGAARGARAGDRGGAGVPRASSASRRTCPRASPRRTSSSARRAASPSARRSRQAAR